MLSLEPPQLRFLPLPGEPVQSLQLLPWLTQTPPSTPPCTNSSVPGGTAPPEWSGIAGRGHRDDKGSEEVFPTVSWEITEIMLLLHRKK